MFKSSLQNIHSQSLSIKIIIIGWNQDNEIIFINNIILIATAMYLDWYISIMNKKWHFNYNNENSL